MANITYEKGKILFYIAVPHTNGKTIPNDLRRCIDPCTPREATLAYLILSADIHGIIRNGDTEIISQCINTEDKKAVNEAKSFCYKHRILKKTENNLRQLTANISVYRKRISKDRDAIIAVANECGCEFQLDYRECILIAGFPSLADQQDFLRYLSGFAASGLNDAENAPGWATIVLAMKGIENTNALAREMFPLAKGLLAAADYRWIEIEDHKFEMDRNLATRVYQSDGLIYVVLEDYILKKMAEPPKTQHTDNNQNVRGTAVAVRLYLAEDGHTPMADIKFAFGSPVTIQWANIAERTKYQNLITAYTLWYDERPKRNFDLW